jgi:hypothetical protein
MSKPTVTVQDLGSMEINLPSVVAEVTAAFMAYQKAVDENDIEMMNLLFWDSPFTVRFAPNGTLVGHAAISAFRHSRTTRGNPRQLKNTIITTFGLNFAATNTESTREGINKISRQSQTWVRTPLGWRIVAAHVSDKPNSADNQI